MQMQDSAETRLRELTRITPSFSSMILEAPVTDSKNHHVSCIQTTKKTNFYLADEIDYPFCE